jgi:hypothetical protein
MELPETGDAFGPRRRQVPSCDAPSYYAPVAFAVPSRMTLYVANRRKVDVADCSPNVAIGRKARLPEPHRGR